MGLMLTWVGLGSHSFATIQESDVVSFAMYSYSPIPVKVAGSARLPKGEVILPAIPSYVKQAIFSSKTVNPFKSVYRSHLYPSVFKTVAKLSFYWDAL